MKYLACAQAAMLSALLVSGSSHGGCVPVQGILTTHPDPSCQIVNALSNWPAAEPPDLLLIQADPGLDPATVCFVTHGYGTARFSGHSGFTAVPVAGSDLNGTATPLLFPTQPGGVRSTLSGFTSQAALSGTLGLGRKKRSGTLFTKDTGTTTQRGVVGQLIMIVGGDRDFEGASGTIAVAGQELGGYALYTGEVCTPD